MNNGGGFVTGASGVDYSNQDGAQYPLTGVTTAGADAILLTASAVADMVGNTCYIASGTNYTTGWYQILSVVVGVSATLDRTCTTAAGALGVVNVGGALGLNSTFDDDFFEQLIAGQTVYIKNGSYTLGEAVSVGATSASAVTPINIIGYNSAFGDLVTPFGASPNAPIIDCGSTLSIVWGQFMNFQGLRYTGSAANVVTSGLGSRNKNFKSVNTSTTTTRVAYAGGQDSFNCIFEAVSQFGTAVSATGNNARYDDFYVHDSTIGIIGNSTRQLYSRGIIHACRQYGYQFLNSSATGFVMQNCTLYGYASVTPKAATLAGVDLPVGSGCGTLLRNIIANWKVGVLQDTTQSFSNGGYSNCIDCTTPNTRYTLDSTDTTAIVPVFIDVTELSGTGATCSTVTLTATGAFTANVTDNVDYIQVHSGTGATVGSYLITGHTNDTLTVNISIGAAGSSIVWTISHGRNFGCNTVGVRGAGIPGPFPMGGSVVSAGYIDVGAVQQPAGGGGTFISRQAVSRAGMY